MIFSLCLYHFLLQNKDKVCNFFKSCRGFVHYICYSIKRRLTSFNSCEKVYTRKHSGIPYLWKRYYLVTLLWLFFYNTSSSFPNLSTRHTSFGKFTWSIFWPSPYLVETCCQQVMRNVDKNPAAARQDGERRDVR